MTILDDALDGMNPDIRPQDDLFGHVNGTWLDTTEIPSDRSSWGPFVQLGDVAEAHVREIVEDLAGALDSPTASAEEKKIAAMYASFMDENRDRCLRHQSDPSTPSIEPPRWLTSMSWPASSDRPSALVGRASSAPTSTATTATPTAISSTWSKADWVSQTSPTTATRSSPRSARSTSPTSSLCLELAEHPDPRGAAETAMAIETRLAEGHWERAETRDVIKTYNLMTGDELRALCPNFDWDYYVEQIGGNDATINEVTVRQPSYLTHLNTVLDEVDMDAWRTLLTVKVLRNAAAYLPNAFVEANFDFYGRTLNGTPELRARWKRGVALVQGALGEAVGREYVARHFPPKAKAMMDELVLNLLEAYRQSIATLDWMSEETKQKAYEKLDTFRPKIGYPDKFRDYSALEVSATDLVANVAAAAAFETDRQLAKIGAPVDRDEWFMLPQTVNAYYNPGTNEICFPAAILQKPFFSPDADPAENYGGIGAVIGHEIGHGFDDQGAQYDGHGNLNDWWTADDKAAFEVKSKALIEQYDGFEPRSLPGEHVNGALTVGENIGDLGGLTIGHKAYRISRGGEMTTEDSKRLFLNWGYIWRTKRRAEQERQYLTIDPHSPPEFRSNIVRNLDEFHEAFGTAEGDGLWLDPDERVRIW